MREPSPRTSRLAIVAALAATIVIGGAGFMLGRGSAPPPPPPAAAPPPATAPSAPQQPEERVLGRADIIALASQAADEASAPEPRPQPGSPLIGRRFEIALPFGCQGPAAEGSVAALRWAHDPDEGVLRISAAPTRWPVEEWQRALGLDVSAVEAIEGFWLARPWSSSEACPARSDTTVVAGAEPVTLPGQTLGLARTLTTSEARQPQRDGRPYQAVVRKAAAELRAEQGFRLRLVGRVGRFPNGRPAACTQPAGSDQRPICLVAMSLDTLAVENPATGEVIATWTLAPGAD